MIQKSQQDVGGEAAKKVAAAFYRIVPSSRNHPATTFDS